MRGVAVVVEIGPKVIEIARSIRAGDAHVPDEGGAQRSRGGREERI